MKFLYFLIFLFSFNILCYSLDINILLKNGKIVKGSLIGKTEKEIFIETKKGKSRIIPKEKIKAIFNAKNGEPVKIGITEYKDNQQSIRVTNANVEETSPVALSEPETLYKPKQLWYKRSVKRYFMLDFIMADSFNLDPSLLGICIGVGAWFRPFDFFAIGGKATIDIFDVYNDEDSMPVSMFGAGIRFIPYSTAKDTKSKSKDYFLEYQYGIASLGGIFSGAAIADISQNGQGIYQSFAVGLRDKGVAMTFAFRILQINNQNLNALFWYINFPIY